MGIGGGPVGRNMMPSEMEKGMKKKGARKKKAMPKGKKRSAGPKPGMFGGY